MRLYSLIQASLLFCRPAATTKHTNCSDLQSSVRCFLFATHYAILCCITVYYTILHHTTPNHTHHTTPHHTKPHQPHTKLQTLHHTIPHPTATSNDADSDSSKVLNLPIGQVPVPLSANEIVSQVSCGQQHTGDWWMGDRAFFISIIHWWCQSLKHYKKDKT